MFGSMQIKAKPVVGTKPKGFDPFGLGGLGKPGQPQNFSGESGGLGKFEREGSNLSGQGSLNRIEGEETPTSFNEEPKKVSAFGFLQKQPIKIQTNQPQGLSFVSNADPSSQIINRNYEGDISDSRNVQDYNEKPPSMTSFSSEPVNTGPQKGPGSAFSFIKKVKKHFS